MAITRNVKCPNCGVFNTNRDYCKNCNTLISFEKKRAQKATAYKEKELKKAQEKISNPNIAERLKNHPFWLYKIVGWILYSGYLLVSAIGAFIAWIIAMVAAG
ncbi:hypothetical protein P8625_06175 [Tenacibaculum tangerinum]|uniref:Zinc ribbon domain-containing protein n=1 Tax=Tenacibaculum tangerinum TaxID=3038772 RepID=A0ABY8L989_9FLAO|nr:hypothetical protein [Tenacibaculum tangerinum]WGH76738.1 hypothetical protein P8625_06175 [Tenacibaculum tangerinum]